MRTRLLIALAATALVASACSHRSAYQAGQSWQRQQCLQIDDPQQRQRCLRSTNTSYEDYQRETEALGKKP